MDVNKDPDNENVSDGGQSNLNASDDEEDETKDDDDENEDTYKNSKIMKIWKILKRNQKIIKI